MGFPTGSLAADEEIALDLHPHWKALVAPAAALVAACGGAGFTMALVPEGASGLWPRWTVAALALGAIARWAVLPWLDWMSTRYVVTSRRLIMRSGVLTRDGRDLPLARVTDVSYRQGSLLERLLGCGTLVVELAGLPSGQRGQQLVLAGLPRVEGAQRDLHRLVVETSAVRAGPVVRTGPRHDGRGGAPTRRRPRGGGELTT